MFTKKGANFSDSHSGEFKFGIADVSRIITGLAYKKSICSIGAASAKAPNEDSKTGTVPANTRLLQKQE
jgi:hypothetical protein